MFDQPETAQSAPHPAFIEAMIVAGLRECKSIHTIAQEIADMMQSPTDNSAIPAPLHDGSR